MSCFQILAMKSEIFTCILSPCTLIIKYTEKKGKLIKNLFDLVVLSHADDIFISQLRPPFLMLLSPVMGNKRVSFGIYLMGTVWLN